MHLAAKYDRMDIFDYLNEEQNQLSFLNKNDDGHEAMEVAFENDNIELFFHMLEKIPVTHQV